MRNLEDHGFKGTVIGAIPVIEWKSLAHVPYRGEEIQAWLSAVDGVDGYVIIDDEEEAGIGGRSHYVQTRRLTGLEDSHVEKAIKILNNELDNESEEEADQEEVP